MATYRIRLTAEIPVNPRSHRGVGPTASSLEWPSRFEEEDAGPCQRYREQLPGHSWNTRVRYCYCGKGTLSDLTGNGIFDRSLQESIRIFHPTRWIKSINGHTTSLQKLITFRRLLLRFLRVLKAITWQNFGYLPP